MNKEKNVGTFKIELNKAGDYIVISTKDMNLFNRFMNGYGLIADMAEKLPQKYKEVERKYGKPCMEKTVEISRINVTFSEDSIEIIDNIFGRDTVKKYFRRLYKKVPDFMPETECFIHFFDHITPVLEELFGCNINDSEKQRIRSMSQYVYH